MKHQSLRYFVTVSAMLLALSAQAHSPKEHMKEAQAPDCAAMKDMDHSKMDMNDPVMQAMMKKCMKTMHKDNDMTTSQHEHEGTSAHCPENKSEHQHAGKEHADVQDDKKCVEKKPPQHEHQH